MELSVAILGIIQLARGRASTSLREPLFSGTTANVSSYALALYSGVFTNLILHLRVKLSMQGLWAFDGWDQTNYVAGEMKNPAKNIPRVIHISMTVVIVSLPSTTRLEVA
jgi:amino acid transporter